jgi:hypothetical protein
MAHPPIAAVAKLVDESVGQAADRNRDWRPKKIAGFRSQLFRVAFRILVGRIFDPPDPAADYPLSLSGLILEPLAELLFPAFEFDQEPEDFARSRFSM